MVLGEVGEDGAVEDDARHALLVQGVAAYFHGQMGASGGDGLGKEQGGLHRERGGVGELAKVWPGLEAEGAQIGALVPRPL